MLIIMELLDGAQTAAEAAIQIAHLPADYQTWLADEVPRSNFQDDKSWIESLKPKLLSYLEAHVKFANATRSMPYKVNKATFMRELTAKKSLWTRGSMRVSTRRSSDWLKSKRLNRSLKSAILTCAESAAFPTNAKRQARLES
jgi:hypothetical protein